MSQGDRAQPHMRRKLKTSTSPKPRPVREDFAGQTLRSGSSKAKEDNRAVLPRVLVRRVSGV